MVGVAAWPVERDVAVSARSGRGRLVAATCVLAANFVLLTFPATLAALVLLGVVR